MMLSGVEWRNCDTCPRRFCVLQGVICDTCPDCQADKKAMGRRSEERQCHAAKKNEAVRKGGRPMKYKTDRERRAAKTKQQQIYRMCPNVEKTVCNQTETKELQAQKSRLSYCPTTPVPLPLESPPIAKV